MQMERAHKKAVIAAREDDAVISIRTFPEGQTAGNDTNEEEEEEAVDGSSQASPAYLPLSPLLPLAFLSLFITPSLSLLKRRG